MRVARSIPMLLLACAPALASAQATLPGGHMGTAAQQRAEYEAIARAHVDTLLTKWEAAISSGEAMRVAALYTPDAVMILFTGARLRGPGNIAEGYARLLPKMRGPMVSIVKVSAGGGMARVDGILTVDVPAAGGGSYVYTTPVKFALQAIVGESFAIAVQEGGDLPLLTSVRTPAQEIAVGHGDSVSVRVGDASGAGLAGVPVTFASTFGHGTVTPDVAATDARGVASAYFSAASAPELDSVSATAEPLPQGAIVFGTRTVPPP